MKAAAPTHICWAEVQSPPELWSCAQLSGEGGALQVFSCGSNYSSPAERPARSFQRDCWRPFVPQLLKLGTGPLPSH